MSAYAVQAIGQAAVDPDPPDVRRWPLTGLRPNPQNPRGPVDPDDPALRELADSIRAQGLLQPLLVTPDGTVVAGHRRLAAARLAGLREVPATVRVLGEREQLELMLVENLQRQALSPLQEARAFRRLVDGGLSVADAARRTGVTATTIKDRLAILDLPLEVQELFGRREVPLGLVRLLATVADPARQAELARLAAVQGLTLAQLESLVRRGQRLASGAGGGGTGGGGSSPEGQGTDRGAALHSLLNRATETVTFARLARLTEAICCACGVHRATPEVCRACPVPKLLTLVAATPAELAQLARGGGR